MTIAYKSQGAGVATETSGAALSPLCPATVDAGDILIAHVYWEGTTTAPNTPSGWTLLDGPQVIQSTIARMWVFGKIADGTEDGAAVAFGNPAVTTQRAARIYSFSGRVSGTITQLVSQFAFLSHATDPQMPTVTTQKAGAMAVALVGQNDNNTAASATGESGGNWTEAVAEFVAALTPGLMLQIQTCIPTADPGTVSGGSVATTNDPCGVIAFQIQDSPPAITGEGTSAGAATVAASGQRVRLASGSASAPATVQGQASAIFAASGNVAGVASISGSATRVLAGAGIAAGVGSTAADGRRVRLAQGISVGLAEVTGEAYDEGGGEPPPTYGYFVKMRRRLG